VLKLLKSVLKERAGWNEVVRSGAIARLEPAQNVAALDLILEYTRLGLQSAALVSNSALGTISTGQTPVNLERILERLEKLSRNVFLNEVAVAHTRANGNPQGNPFCAL